MKKNKITLSALVFLMAFFFLFSCKKKTGDTAPAPTPTGTIGFHIHTNIDTTEAAADSVVHDATGRQIRLHIAQFYISNIVLHKTNGVDYAMSGIYALKNIDTEEFMFGEVPAGNYKSVSFDVGIDASTNQSSPSSYAASSPLSPQTPAMWFGSTSQGYIFVNVQGYADTTAGNSGSVNVPFSYQLGTSAALKTINMPDQAFTVTANQAQLIHLTCDYGKLLQGINFKTQGTATPFGNAAEQATATQLINNITGMFRYEM